MLCWHIQPLSLLSYFKGLYAANTFFVKRWARYLVALVYGSYRICVVGFNAPVAGTFFAIETVLRPQHAENSPPLTTAMIILAAVISSTVSQILLGERPAFTVPPYELRSAAGTILHKDISSILRSSL